MAVQPIPRPTLPTTGVVRGVTVPKGIGIRQPKLPKNFLNGSPKQARPTSSSSEPQSTVRTGARSAGPKNPAKGRGNGAAPNWLAPLSQKQVLNEATQIVNREYKPAFGDINSQVRQAQALDAKRASDFTQYNNWLASQGAALQTANSTMMSTLEGANAALAAGANQGIDSAAGTVSGAVQAEANPAAATNANAMLTGALAAEGKQRVGTDTQASNTSGAIGASQLGDATANAYSGMSEVRATQLNQLDTTLQKLAATRATTRQQKVADLAKEINTLQTNEVNKAQANRSYQQALTQLGLSEANTQSEINARTAATKISAANTQSEINARRSASKISAINAQTSRMNANTSLSRAQQEAMAQDRTYRLDVRKEGVAEAKDAYERQHHLGVYKLSATTPGGRPALSQTSSNAMYNQLDGTRGEISKMMGAHDANGQPLTPQQIASIIANGGTYYTTEPTTRTVKGKTVVASRIVAHTAKQQTNLAILNAAFSLHQNGYLTTKQLKALNAEGLYGVRKRYRIKAPSNPRGVPAGAGGY